MTSAAPLRSQAVPCQLGSPRQPARPHRVPVQPRASQRRPATLQLNTGHVAAAPREARRNLHGEKSPWGHRRRNVKVGEGHEPCGSSDTSQSGSPLGTDQAGLLPAAAPPPGDSCLSTLVIIVPGARLTPVSLQGVGTSRVGARKIKQQHLTSGPSPVAPG